MSVELRLARRIEEMEQSIRDLKAEVGMADEEISAAADDLAGRVQALEAKTEFDTLSAGAFSADDAQMGSILVNGIAPPKGFSEITATTNIDYLATGFYYLNDSKATHQGAGGTTQTSIGAGPWYFIIMHYANVNVCMAVPANGASVPKWHRMSSGWASL